MKSLHTIVFVSLLSAVTVCAQNSGSTSAKATTSPVASSERSAPFRVNKEQISAAQTLLKSKGHYSGAITGKYDTDTRAAIKSFQKANGLRSSGSLNRATLEKMNIDLTEKQKTMPVDEDSFAKAKGGSGDDKPRRAPFRATKEQVIEAQKLLKAGKMYDGEESGKLDDATRDGLRKYQEANGLKATGTLNQVTLEKMGITLTDKQRGSGGTR